MPRWRRRAALPPRQSSDGGKPARFPKRHLQTIADLTGKSVAWLLGDQAADPLEQQLVYLFRRLPLAARDKLLQEAQWLESQRSDRPSRANPYPKRVKSP